MYVSENEWARFIWHCFYENNGKIDNVIIGSSHVFCDINPTQLDEINGQYNFNLSASALRMNGAYYLMKEADRNNSLSHVYLELYYPMITKDVFNSNVDPINIDYHWNWNNTDNMRFSLNKIEYMLDIAGPDKYVNICFPFSRYLAKLDMWDSVRQRIKKKQDSDYIAYKHYENHEDGSYIEYVKQGYSYNTKKFGNKVRLKEQTCILEENPMGEVSEKYLRKIIEYCQKKDIPIILFVSPIDELQLMSVVNYDNFLVQINNIADEYDVEFYDFNLAKEEYLSIQKGEYFRDEGHLNDSGATIFTAFFGEVMSRCAAENEKCFYNSYEEKLQDKSPAVYGLYYREYKSEESAQGEKYRKIWIASNRNEGMEYKVVMAPDEGEQYLVQDFTENKEFTIDADEHGMCTIMSRMTADPENMQSLEIQY
ncbi:MAG: hypothetical protein HDR03_06795 [Lachnospiraceae bacterium]|nr:hypothetical protein [Lachnospiraceae bacterium]